MSVILTHVLFKDDFSILPNNFVPKELHFAQYY